MKPLNLLGKLPENIAVEYPKVDRPLTIGWSKPFTFSIGDSFKFKVEERKKRVAIRSSMKVGCTSMIEV